MSIDDDTDKTNSEQESKYTERRLSIADKANISYNEPNPKGLIEPDYLASMIGYIVGSMPIQAILPRAPADELVRLLIEIREGVEASPEGTLSMLDDAIELAFLHTPAYRAALELYRLEQSHQTIACKTAYEVIEAEIRRSRETRPVDEVNEESGDM